MSFLPKRFLYIPSVNKNLEADLSQTLYEHRGIHWNSASGFWVHI